MKKILTTLGEVIYLNLLFIVTSIPLITVGTAMTTSYEIIDLIDRDFEMNILARYFEKFKKNLRKTMGINIIASVLFFIFLLICRFLYLQEGIIGKIIFYLFISSALLIYITLVYYYYLVAKLKEKSIQEIIKYSLYLGVKNIGISLVMTAVHLVVLGTIFFFPAYSFIIWEIFIIIGFSLIFYLNYKLFQKIKY